MLARSGIQAAGLEQVRRTTTSIIHHPAELTGLL
jgi:hypothetical protein